MGGVSTHEKPKKVAVVGAGIVGLATAWHLQGQDVEVTVLDRQGVAAGSSWGNAGWLTPSIATPLPEPGVLRYGLRALSSVNSPVYVPLRPNVSLVRFLAGFTRNCTKRRWQQAMHSLIPVNARALDAFAELEDGGIQSNVNRAEPLIAAYLSAEERQLLLEEFEHIRCAGGDVSFDLLSGAEAQAAEPALSTEIRAAIALHEQRYIVPGDFVSALGHAVTTRGGTIHSGVSIESVEGIGRGVSIHARWPNAEVAADRLQFDAAIIASGADLGALARPHGVRTVVQAGRGYSFSARTENAPRGPIYFPSQRVGCTPLADNRLRFAGMMEFRPSDAPLDERRIAAIKNSARSMLSGVDLELTSDHWVGSRPCTPDGLPLVGATRTPGVYVAGGHGMWGVTLGPITGKLLAAMITSGEQPTELAPFDPTR